MAETDKSKWPKGSIDFRPHLPYREFDDSGREVRIGTTRKTISPVLRPVFEIGAQASEIAAPTTFCSFLSPRYSFSLRPMGPR